MYSLAAGSHALRSRPTVAGRAASARAMPVRAVGAFRPQDACATMQARSPNRPHHASPSETCEDKPASVAARRLTSMAAQMEYHLQAMSLAAPLQVTTPAMPGHNVN